MTLASTPRIPSWVIEPFFGKEDWDALVARRYEAFVILHATAREDRSVRLGGLLAAVPDASYEAKARVLCEDIRVSSVSVASHGNAQVEVYVVFYDYGRGLREALIFARQEEPVAPTGTSSEMRYLGAKHY